MKKRIFNSDTQSLLGTFIDSEKDSVVNKYEELGYEVCEDHDGDLVICQPEED